ncbi:MAG: ribonuclease HII [Candidatus Saccharimonadales bacterium]
MILGIDEVGRGSWAGPLVVGAVVLGGAQIDGLTDSKKLTKKRREELDVIIRETALGIGLGWVPASEIDEIGLSAALRLATIRAVEQIKAPYHEIIIDGTINFLSETSKGKYVKTLPKADLLIPSVSAASIVAKVARDNYMKEQGNDYREYGFDQHVGYGTKKHSDAIEKFGVTLLHRLSFAPLKKYAPKNTKELGNFAEDVATKYLKKLGHKILARNWKTKTCEIDIVSEKSGTIFFTEVKHRNNDQQGGGLSAITTKKQDQMKYAANLFVSKNNLYDNDMRLTVISTAGKPPEVIEYIEL